MTTAVLCGPDEDGLGDALGAAGVDVRRIDDRATRPALEDAGIHDADLFVLTDLTEATAVPVARDLNDDLRTVVYASDGLPEFLSGSEVLKMDPRLLGAEAVAEELLNGA
jgi:hypothetical protein